MSKIPKLERKLNNIGFGMYFIVSRKFEWHVYKYNKESFILENTHSAGNDTGIVALKYCNKLVSDLKR